MMRFQGSLPRFIVSQIYQFFTAHHVHLTFQIDRWLKRLLLPAGVSAIRFFSLNLWSEEIVFSVSRWFQSIIFQ